jgi:hypothetical protein
MTLLVKQFDRCFQQMIDIKGLIRQLATPLAKLINERLQT